MKKKIYKENRSGAYLANSLLMQHFPVSKLPPGKAL